MQSIIREVYQGRFLYRFFESMKKYIKSWIIVKVEFWYVSGGERKIFDDENDPFWRACCTEGKHIRRELISVSVVMIFVLLVL